MNTNHQKKSLLVAIFLNLLFALTELITGLLANSLTLVAGALHDAGDAVALGLAYLGLRLARLPPTPRRTFGYRKVQILIAFINALSLAVFTILVLRSAVLRIIQPEPVKSPILILMALLGIGINGSALLFLRHHQELLNIRAAMWHLFDDLLSFIAFLIGGLVIRFTSWSVIDPLLSILVSCLVLYGVWRVFRQSVSILIDSTPQGLSFDEVREFILGFAPEIQAVHDLHIWTLGEGERALMAHLRVKDAPLSSFYPLLYQLECKLKERFGINHTTLELECEKCKSQDNICS